MSSFQYYSYPTQTSVKIRFEQSSYFPAITFCSGNPFRYDRLGPALLSWSNESTLSMADAYLLMVNFIVDLFNQNRSDLIQYYGFQLDDILLDCTYNGLDCYTNRSQLFVRSISTITGNCYTFNAKVGNISSLYKTNDFGNGWTVENGLVLTFYLNQQWYTPTYYANSLTAILHDNDEFPLVRYVGQYYQPGLDHQILYTKHVTTYLGSPYTQCTTQMGEDMQALYSTAFGTSQFKYSQTVCYELCAQSYIYHQCRCTIPIYFFVDKLVVNNQLVSVNACSVHTDEGMCAAEARQNFLNDLQLQSKQCVHCQPECEIMTFETDTSSLRAPTELQKLLLVMDFLNTENKSATPLPADFEANYTLYLDKNYLKLKILPVSQYVTSYTEMATYSWVAFMSDIGGQSGFWMGLSVSSIIELIGLIYRKKLLKCFGKDKVQAFSEDTVDSKH
ncbi:unnamed protein product [Didymodactylos carnosus]|uniref:Uncharacterized protein n=1 Tax=Didymodactylos carnosus TaxID=1234261 RepID=A0A814DE05_9BILA|nr:unnamed protein product [Didymodactylos carnosus]CAF3728423.1 unnamed protein product [Didymodactylos carnosus]